MKKLSVVVPCYNEAAVIGIFCAELVMELSRLNVDYEILFVNDGSSDDTLDIIKALSKNNNKIFYISLSRNFGKEASLYAGLKKASGDYVAVMDADPQDPTSLLGKMISYIECEGFDCVGTRRSSRIGEPPIRSFFANVFYKVINKISEVAIVNGARDFQVMTRRVVDSILSVKECNRFSKGIVEWIGFRKKWIEYSNIERVAGETKWSFWKLFVYAIEGIVAFTTVPLLLAAFCGIFLCFISLIITAITIFRGSTQGLTLLVSIILFVSGIQLFFLGILGQYLAKAYLEIKNRPIYIVKETNTKNNSNKEDCYETV